MSSSDCLYGSSSNSSSSGGGGAAKNTSGSSGATSSAAAASSSDYQEKISSKDVGSSFLSPGNYDSITYKHTGMQCGYLSPQTRLKW